MAQLGALVIDADAITRELQEPGQPVLEAMIQRFGEEILLPDGHLDRQAVADLVFNDEERLRDLNAIVHPAVGAEIAQRMQEAAGTDRVVVLDVPLLVESGRSDMRGLLVVDVDPEVAVDRLVRFRGVREDDARARIARQASREQRLAAADFVIDNSGTEAELDAQVELAWEWIRSLGDGSA